MSRTSLTDADNLARETAEPNEEKSSIDLQPSVTHGFEPDSVDQQSIIALQFGGDKLQSVDDLNLGGEVELFLYEEQVFIMEKVYLFFYHGYLGSCCWLHCSGRRYLSSKHSYLV